MLKKKWSSYLIRRVCGQWPKLDPKAQNQEPTTYVGYYYQSKKKIKEETCDKFYVDYV